MTKRKLTKKEASRQNQKKNTDIQFSKFDLDYIDSQILNYFSSLYLKVTDETQGNDIISHVSISTPERWKILREGIYQGTATSKNTKRSILPALSILRGDIEKDENQNKPNLYEVVVSSKWSKKNQYSSQNIDKYINKNYNSQRENQIMRFPVFVNINYDLGILTVLQSQMDKILEPLLTIDKETVIHTDKGGIRIILKFNSTFSNNSNMSDFSETQRKFETNIPFVVSTELIPEYDFSKMSMITKKLTSLDIKFTDEVITFF